MSSTSNVNGPQGQDPWSDYGVGDTNDPYGNEGWGDEQTGGAPGDQYVGPEGETGGTPLPVKETLSHLKELLTQIRNDDSLDAKTKSELIAKINKLTPKLQALLNQHVETMPGELAQQVNDVELTANPVTGEGVDGEGGDPSVSLKAELEGYKTKIQDNKNLSDAKKQQYLSKVDQWLQGMELKTLSAEDIQPLFDQLKQDVTTASAFSPSVQSLSETIPGTSPEEIEAALRAKGLDPANLPVPPTMEVLQVLADLSPDFKEKLGAVKDAVKARNDEIKTQTDAANKQNSDNVACSSDNDTTDMVHFQFLYDAKYHQDGKSKDVMTAQKDAVNALLPLLKGLYPPPAHTVDVVPTAEGSGYNDTEKDYNVSGLLKFDGGNVDLFRAADGELQASTTVDTEQAVTVIGVQYDWEGSGDWEDKSGAPSLTKYGDNTATDNKYDTG